MILFRMIEEEDDLGDVGGDQSIGIHSTRIPSHSEKTGG